MFNLIIPFLLGLFIFTILIILLLTTSQNFTIKNHNLIIIGIFSINIILIIFTISYFYYKKKTSGASGIKGATGNIGPTGENKIKCLA